MNPMFVYSSLVLIVALALTSSASAEVNTQCTSKAFNKANNLLSEDHMDYDNLMNYVSKAEQILKANKIEPGAVADVLQELVYLKPLIQQTQANIFNCNTDDIRILSRFHSRVQAKFSDNCKQYGKPNVAIAVSRFQALYCSTCIDKFKRLLHTRVAWLDHNKVVALQKLEGLARYSNRGRNLDPRWTTIAQVSNSNNIGVTYDIVGRSTWYNIFMKLYMIYYNLDDIKVSGARSGVHKFTVLQTELLFKELVEDTCSYYLVPNERNPYFEEVKELFEHTIALAGTNNLPNYNVVNVDLGVLHSMTIGFQICKEISRLTSFERGRILAGLTASIISSKENKQLLHQH